MIETTLLAIGWILAALSLLIAIRTEQNQRQKQKLSLALALVGVFLIVLSATLQTRDDLSQLHGDIKRLGQKLDRLTTHAQYDGIFRTLDVADVGDPITTDAAREALLDLVSGYAKDIEEGSIDFTDDLQGVQFLATFLNGYPNPGNLVIQAISTDTTEFATYEEAGVNYDKAIERVCKSPQGGTCRRYYAVPRRFLDSRRAHEGTRASSRLFDDLCAEFDFFQDHHDAGIEQWVFADEVLTYKSSDEYDLILVKTRTDSPIISACRRQIPRSPGSATGGADQMFYLEIRFGAACGVHETRLVRFLNGLNASRAEPLRGRETQHPQP